MFLFQFLLCSSCQEVRHFYFSMRCLTEAKCIVAHVWCLFFWAHVSICCFSMGSGRQAWCGGGGQKHHPPCRVSGHPALPQPPNGVDPGQTEGPSEGGALGLGPQQPRVFCGESPGHVPWSPPEGLQWLQQGPHLRPRVCFQWRQLLPCHQQWDFLFFQQHNVDCTLLFIISSHVVWMLFFQMWSQLIKVFTLVICTIITVRFASQFKSSSMSPSQVRFPNAADIISWVEMHEKT